MVVAVLLACAVAHAGFIGSLPVFGQRASIAIRSLTNTWLASRFGLSVTVVLYMLPLCLVQPRTRSAPLTITGPSPAGRNVTPLLGVTVSG